MSFVVQMVVLALRKVLYVTSIRTVLMALMRNIVVSFAYYPYYIYSEQIERSKP
jgi:hypothetical protein